VSGPARCTEEQFNSFFLPQFEQPEYQTEDLDNFNEQLQDDYQECALDTLSIICDHLENEEAFRQLVSQHQKLLATLIDNVLTHDDASHVRGGLLALKFLCDCNDNCRCKLVNQGSILRNVIPLLEEDRSNLIRKYAVRLLFVLAQSENKWPLDSKQFEKMAKNLQKCEDPLLKSNKENSDFINKQMFQTILRRVPPKV
jgi:hypothetical protein